MCHSVLLLKNVGVSICTLWWLGLCHQGIHPLVQPGPGISYCMYTYESVQKCIEKMRLFCLNVLHENAVEKLLFVDATLKLKFSRLLMYFYVHSLHWSGQSIFRGVLKGFEVVLSGMGFGTLNFGLLLLRVVSFLYRVRDDR